jgi:hypothetical protein
MCNYDQRCCPETIFKDNMVYIVDDYGGIVRMTFLEFENIINKYKEKN